MARRKNQRRHQRRRQVNRESWRIEEDDGGKKSWVCQRQRVMKMQSKLAEIERGRQREKRRKGEKKGGVLWEVVERVMIWGPHVCLVRKPLSFLFLLTWFTSPNILIFFWLSKKLMYNFSANCRLQRHSILSFKIFFKQYNLIIDYWIYFDLNYLNYLFII